MRAVSDPNAAEAQGDHIEAALARAGGIKRPSRGDSPYQSQISSRDVDTLRLHVIRTDAVAQKVPTVKFASRADSSRPSTRGPQRFVPPEPGGVLAPDRRGRKFAPRRGCGLRHPRRGLCRSRRGLCRSGRGLFHDRRRGLRPGGRADSHGKSHDRWHEYGRDQCSHGQVSLRGGAVAVSIPCARRPAEPARANRAGPPRARAPSRAAHAAAIIARVPAAAAGGRIRPRRR